MCLDLPWEDETKGHCQPDQHSKTAVHLILSLNSARACQFSAAGMQSCTGLGSAISCRAYVPRCYSVLRLFDQVCSLCTLHLLMAEVFAIRWSLCTSHLLLAEFSLSVCLCLSLSLPVSFSLSVSLSICLSVCLWLSISVSPSLSLLFFRSDGIYIDLPCIYSWLVFYRKVRSVCTLCMYPLARVQAHKTFKRTLFFRTKIKTQSTNVQGNALYQATKRHLNNS